MNSVFKQPKNIVMVIMAICLIILLFVVFKKKPEVINNSEAITILQEQNAILTRQNEALRKQADDQRRTDSVLIRKYEDRIYKDYRTIEELKNKRDEKNTVIDTAGNDLLRRILSEG